MPIDGVWIGIVSRACANSGSRARRNGEVICQGLKHGEGRRGGQRDGRGKGRNEPHVGDVIGFLRTVAVNLADAVHAAQFADAGCSGGTGAAGSSAGVTDANAAQPSATVAGEADGTEGRPNAGGADSMSLAAGDVVEFRVSQRLSAATSHGMTIKQRNMARRDIFVSGLTLVQRGVPACVEHRGCSHRSRAR